MIINGVEYVLVPKVATDEMCAAFRNGCVTTDRGTIIGVQSALSAAIAAAPQPQIVVTDEMRTRVIHRMIDGLPSVSYNRSDVATAYLHAWQAELGPQLGLVNRDAEIAALKRSCEDWESQMRTFRETENAEIAELRRDAERMRRLDEHWVRRLVRGEVSEGQAAKATGLARVELRRRADEIDAAIDAARGGE